MMKIAYVMPFRAPFALDKETLLARHDEWVGAVSAARERIAAGDGPPAAVIGNYGWGFKPADGDDEPLIHGEGGIESETLFERSHFVLGFGEDLPAGELPVFGDDPGLGELMRSGTGHRWECRLTNNTVAILILRLDLERQAFLDFIKERQGNAGKEYFIEFGNAWSKATLLGVGPTVLEACGWARTHLAEPLDPDRRKVSDVLFTESRSPLYAFDPAAEKLQPKWAHVCFVFEPEALAALEGEKRAFLRLFQEDGRVAAWLDGGANAYGWGASAVVEEKRFEGQWLNALCISEYYYTCFDIADAELSVEIAHQRAATDDRRFRSVTATIHDLRHAVTRLQADYEDILTRSNSESRRALATYYDVWRLTPLLDGLERKLAWLAELRTRATDSINEQAQKRTQKILSYITFLSLLGVASGTHSYLADAYDPDAPGFFARVAFELSRAWVLVVSFTIIVILAVLARVMIDGERPAARLGTEARSWRRVTSAIGRILRPSSRRSV